MKLLNSFIALLVIAFSVNTRAQEVFPLPLVKNSDKVVIDFQKAPEAIQSINTKGIKQTNATLPFYEDFEDGEDNWTLTGGDNAPSTNYIITQTYTDGSITYKGGHSSSNHFLMFVAANTWAISDGFVLEADKTYTFSAWASTANTDDTEDIQIAVGTSATSAAMTEVIFDDKIEGNNWAFFSAEFTPDEGGTYYFGISSKTANGDFWIIDDVKINEKASELPVADFEVQVESGVQLSSIPYGSSVKIVDKSTNNPLYLEIYPYIAQTSEIFYNTSSDIYIPYIDVKISEQLEIKGAGQHNIRVKAVNEAGEHEKTENNILTVSDRGYSNLPYEEYHTVSQRDPFKAATLSRGWASYPRYASQAGLGFYTRNFYLEPGSYHLGTVWFAGGNGGDVLVYVQDVAGTVGGTWTSGREFEVTNTTDYTYQDSYFTISQAGNYVFLFQSTYVANNSIVGYIGMMLEKGTLTSLNDTDYPNLHVYTANKSIVVEGVEGNLVTVYSVSGQAVESRIVEDNATFAVNEGLYIVKVGEKATKVVVK